MKQVREAAAAVNLPVAIMLDTKGPEIRMGKFCDKGVFLSEGRVVTAGPLDECLEAYRLAQCAP